MPRVIQPDPFIASPAAIEALRQAQWVFDPGGKSDVYAVRLKLASPAITTPAKADIPVPGLPTLDGFLSFVAFRAALEDAMRMQPDLANELLWQWNSALRNPAHWLSFSLPLKRVVLAGVPVYDCSVGLPILDGKRLIPAGAFFALGADMVPYPQAIDYIDLRRRVVLPYHRPLQLKQGLDTSSGRNKALDNRIYFALTDEFVFYFRGDVTGVRRLLEFACERRIGIGKKTTLGYGQIASYEVGPATGVSATFAQPLEGASRERPFLAMVKTLPYHAVLTARDKADRDLFGCASFRLVNAVETLGACVPPYWRRESQTQVLLYGSTIVSTGSP
jgi:hypothetical protein